MVRRGPVDIDHLGPRRSSIDRHIVYQSRRLDIYVASAFPCSLLPLPRTLRPVCPRCLAVCMPVHARRLRCGGLRCPSERACRELQQRVVARCGECSVRLLAGAAACRAEVFVVSRSQYRSLNGPDVRRTSSMSPAYALDICHPRSLARRARRGMARACACCVPSLPVARAASVDVAAALGLCIAPPLLSRCLTLALRCSLYSRCMATRVGCCLIAFLSLLCT
ncbi:hypothetical protein C8T65DRAFT_67721 [Cerioporus squamosus]|nr:hypothetical protein C8T65DRAFT_67721 [Cerioporus squamosus]